MKYSPIKSIMGQKFGKLTVIEITNERCREMVVWKCLCECGNTCFADSKSLRQSNTRSCGCLLKTRSIKHNGCIDPRLKGIYRLWMQIKARCFNTTREDYKLYGAKGITLHKPWVSDFVAFSTYILTTLGEHTKGIYLDRINPTGHYEPGNLRWATPLQQAYNRNKPNRKSSSKYKGVNYIKSSGRWRATISYNRKHHFIGSFSTELEAARAYNKEALIHHKQFAVLNKIDE